MATAHRQRNENSLEHHYETPTALRHDARTLMEDARALVEATSEIADEKVTQARERLAEALERGKHTYQRFQQKAIEGAKVTDEAIRTHPYQTAAVAFGVGALVGALLARRP